VTVPLQWHQQTNQQHPVGKKPKVTRLGIIVLVVVLLGGGLVTYFVTRNSPSEGDCATPKDQSRERLEWVKADCSSPQAMYKLIDDTRSRNPDCPDGDYVTDTSSRSRKTKRKTRKCFMLNVREGDCLTLTKYSAGTLYSRAACNVTPHKVTKVVNGKADEKLCATGDDSNVYSEPATTVCISKV
jgi:hypothetical protein